jgi:hypothetical protein
MRGMEVLVLDKIGGRVIIMSRVLLEKLNVMPEVTAIVHALQVLILILIPVLRSRMPLMKYVLTAPSRTATLRLVNKVVVV